MKATAVVLQLPNPRERISKLCGDPLRSQDLLNTLWQSFHDSYFNKSKRGKSRIINYLIGFHTAVESETFPASPCSWIQYFQAATLGDGGGGQRSPHSPGPSATLQRALWATVQWFPQNSLPSQGNSLNPAQPDPLEMSQENHARKKKKKSSKTYAIGNRSGKTDIKNFSITFLIWGLAHSTLSPFLGNFVLTSKYSPCNLLLFSSLCWFGTFPRDDG